jgi:carboxylesterase type B
MLGQAMRSHWTQFAKTGTPNTQDLPAWPAYDARLDQRFELGRTIGVRPVAPRLRALGHIMERIVAETTNLQAEFKSN